MIKVFACVHDFHFVKEMLDHIDGSDGVVMAGITTAMPKSTHAFHNVSIDVVVLDCTMHKEEALQLARMLYADENLQLRFVFMVKELDDEITQCILDFKQDANFVIAPFTLRDLKQVIAKEGQFQQGMAYAKQTMEGFASQILQNMGLPLHLKGFTYIKSAALLLYQNHGIVQIPMKQVYKEIARMHGSTATRVEKTIRTSIEYAYRTTPHLIAIRNEKPTNSQLIHLICERILLYELEQKREVTA